MPTIRVAYAANPGSDIEYDVSESAFRAILATVETDDIISFVRQLRTGGEAMMVINMRHVASVSWKMRER